MKFQSSKVDTCCCLWCRWRWWWWTWWFDRIWLFWWGGGWSYHDDDGAKRSRSFQELKQENLDMFISHSNLSSKAWQFKRLVLSEANGSYVWDMSTRINVLYGTLSLDFLPLSSLHYNSLQCLPCLASDTVYAWPMFAESSLRKSSKIEYCIDRYIHTFIHTVSQSVS